MPFVVTATDQTKPVTLEQATAKGAVKKAIELSGRGMRDVAITDLVGGRTYRSGEFHLLIDER